MQRAAGLGEDYLKLLRDKETETAAHYSWNYFFSIANIILITVLAVAPLFYRVHASIILFFLFLFFFHILSVIHNMKFLQLSFKERVTADNYHLASLNLVFLTLIMFGWLGSFISGMLKYSQCMRRAREDHNDYNYCDSSSAYFLGLYQAIICLLMYGQPMTYFRYTRKLREVKRDL